MRTTIDLPADLHHAVNAMASHMGEPIASVLDNLDRAHRLGLLQHPAEDWLAARALRNRMAHEDIRNPAALADAVNAAHAATPMVVMLGEACHSYLQQRGLI